MSTLLAIENLHKIYPGGTHALKGVDLEVSEGEFLVVIGLSGSGKSTLLRCINQLHDCSGRIHFAGREITQLGGRDLRQLRSCMGMVFQQFNLIPRKTVLVNVLAGALAQTGVLTSMLGLFSNAHKRRAQELIELVGLKGREHHRADKLSGGQQQRVAMARALMQNPRLLLADEPVASLDPATSHSVMKYLKKIQEELGVTVICNLHFLSLVRQYATRVIALKEGVIVYRGAPSEIDEKWFKTIYGEEAREVKIN